MQLESKKLLQDVSNAFELLARFAEGRSLEDYRKDPMLRAAAETEFGIVGEASKQLADRDADTAKRIPELRRIVSFRDILVHGYADADHEVVWEALTTRVAPLREVVRSRLG